MIQLIIDNVEVPIKVIKFSDGGTNIKLEVPEALIKYPPSAYYSISVDPTTPVDNYMWEIGQAVDAIQETFGMLNSRKYLKLPYLPHGRADRVFEPGNGHPLRMVMAICSFFDVISLTDPHSDYYAKCPECEDVQFDVKLQHQCFIEVVGNNIESGDVLVAPDKGALNKIYKLQQALDTRMKAVYVVEAGKKRDVETGRVVETTLPETADLKGKRVFIVDDILDGGGTFIPLAEKLKEAGASEVNLYITHGIFAKGLDIFRGLIDNIYCYQTVGKYVNRLDIENFNSGK
jgi:ribose-phosphate pyrophosphokinase